MTAQRTDEESTVSVGQENPGDDVAQDSTERTIDHPGSVDAATAVADPALETGTGDDVALDATDTAASSGQGDGAGGPELGDAAALQDRADDAVDAFGGGGYAEQATDGASAAGDAVAATDASETLAASEPIAEASDVPSAEATAEAADGPSAEATADVTETADLTETAATADLTETAATADLTDTAGSDLVTADGDRDPGATAVDGTPAADDTSADDAPVAADELAAAPSAEPDEPPAPVIDTRPEPTTMEELLNEQSGDIRSFKHGDVVEGNVVRIDKDEILVDIGAKSEGVVSNRELYGRHGEAQPQLSIGDVVLVYVLQPESNEGHAVLSLRRAGLERKWRAMQEQFDTGVIIEAPVIDHNKGGLIVDCGIRGFVPISQIVDFPRRPQNEQPRDAAQEIAEKLQPFVGRKLRLKILEVNRKANRLILSEKVALYEERREKRDELFSSLQVGQKVTGSVRSIAPFGVFVDLGGIDGLVHKSELSWNKVNNPEHGYKVGEEVEAEVIDINHERGRISLSIRRLQPDPWHSTVADLKVNDLIDGTVTKIVNFGAFVRVRDGLEGLIHISELSHQRVAHPGDVVHEGQHLKLKIISLDSERHRLGLSLKQAEEAPARPPSEPRSERPRGRSERAYDPSQAVQEPEGGIDNTLAAAFAQVRQQVAQSEQSRRSSEDDELADAPAAEDVSDVSHVLDVDEAEAQAPAAESADAETAAPAMEIGQGEAVAEAPETTTDDASATEATADAADTATSAEASAEAAIADTATSAEASAEAAPADTEPDADNESAATVDAAADTAITDETGMTAEADATGQAAADEPTVESETTSAEATMLDQGSADDEAPSVDETGIAAGATEASATGSDDTSTGDDRAEGASDSAPSDGADREG